MPTNTTTYSFQKPVVGADEDDWGGYLNSNWDKVDDLFDGTTAITGIDINSGTIDGTVIGGSSAAAGTFTTLTVDGGTIKLDGNYPVGTGNVALGDAALGDASLSGANNVAVGTAALSANTTGFENVAVGRISLNLNTTGYYNTAIGSQALDANTSGLANSS